MNDTYSDKKDKAAIIIHSSASASAVAAAAIATMPVVGPAALEFPILTAITVGMVVVLSRLYGYDPDREKLAAIVSVVLGTATGSVIALVLFSLIPGVGSGINAAVTFAITETIGWGFFRILEEGKDPIALSLSEQKEIYSRGKSERTKELEEMKWLTNLPSDVKDKYDQLIKELSKTKQESELDRLQNEIMELLTPYKQ